MVMKINCDVDLSLIIKIEYDDGTSKTNVVSEGDYVEVTYNYNGVRRRVTGTVSSIHANPEDVQGTRKDWYMIIHTDDPKCPVAVKVLISNIIDVEVLHKKRQINAVNTPNNAMRVTDIRLNGGYLQVSNNNGASWKTVGTDPVTDVDENFDLDQRIQEVVNGEHTSEELINSIKELIKEEARRIHNNHCHCYEDYDG